MPEDDDDLFISAEELEEKQAAEMLEFRRANAPIQPTRRGRGRPPLYAPGERPKSWVQPPSPRKAMEAFRDLESEKYYPFLDLFQLYTKWAYDNGVEPCGKASFGTVLNQARISNHRKKVDGRIQLMRYLSNRFFDYDGARTWVKRPVNGTEMSPGPVSSTS